LTNKTKIQSTKTVTSGRLTRTREVDQPRYRRQVTKCYGCFRGFHQCRFTNWMFSLHNTHTSAHGIFNASSV